MLFPDIGTPVPSITHSAALLVSLQTLWHGCPHSYSIRAPAADRIHVSDEPMPSQILE